MVNAAVAQSRYTIYSDAPLGSSEIRPTGLRFDAFDGNSVSAPETTVTAAPGDGSSSIALTPQPKIYGWGFLNQSATTPATTADIANDGWMKRTLDPTLPTGVAAHGILLARPTASPFMGGGRRVLAMSSARTQ